MSLHDVSTEIGDIAAWHAARLTSSPGDVNVSRIATNMVNALKRKILGLREFGTTDALTLGSVVDDSALPDDYKAEIQHAIDARLDGAASAVLRRGCTEGAAKPQRLLSILFYLTMADWNAIRDPRVNLMSKVLVICKRYGRLGITSCHEQTYKWMVAVITAVLAEETGQFPKYKSIYAILLNCKETMDGQKAKYPHGHIVEYPSSPHMLSPEQFAYAYTDDDPPVEMEIDRLTVIANNHVPLRKNSALLTKEAADETAVQRAPDQSGDQRWDELLRLLRRRADDDDIGCKLLPPRNRREALADREADYDSQSAGSVERYRGRRSDSQLSGRSESHIGDTPPNGTPKVESSPPSGPRVKDELAGLKFRISTRCVQAEPVTESGASPEAGVKTEGSEPEGCTAGGQRVTTEEIEAAAFNGVKNKQTRKKKERAAKAKAQKAMKAMKAAQKVDTEKSESESESESEAVAAKKPKAMKAVSKAAAAPKAAKATAAKGEVKTEVKPMKAAKKEAKPMKAVTGETEPGDEMPKGKVKLMTTILSNRVAWLPGDNKRSRGAVTSRGHDRAKKDAIDSGKFTLNEAGIVGRAAYKAMGILYSKKVKH